MVRGVKITNCQYHVDKLIMMRGFIYYVYMASFALSRYHIWITSGLVLNVISLVSVLTEPMHWPPRQEDVSL